ncbi:MAG: FecR domain-containing protein [Sandaracinaceae bacterium]
MKRPLSEHLDDAFARDELADGLAGVERGIRRHRVRRRVARAAALSIPLLLVAGWLALRPGERPVEMPAPTELPAPLALDDGQPLPPSLGEAPTVHLDDGSRLTIERGSELSVAANERGVAAFALDRGVVRFDVRPGGPRRWRILAGPLTVEVLGTAFTVRHDGPRASVSVHRGVVAVTTRDGTRRLVAGERLAVGEPEAPPPTPPEPPVALDPAPAPVPVDELLARADARRRASDLDGAVRALRAIAETHPDAPEAASAALSWGQIEEDRARPDAAVRAYRRALRLHPAPALRELAYLRLVRAQVADGDRPGAEATARTYAERFPNGAHRGAIEALLR